MNRYPPREEHEDLERSLAQAAELRSTARLIIQRLEQPNANLRAAFPIRVELANDVRSAEDFLLLTAFGTITARFEFAKISRMLDGQLVALQLNGVYKFFFTQVNHVDEPVTTLLCTFYFDPVNFRLGSEDGAGYKAQRQFGEQFPEIIFTWLLANVVDLFPRVDQTPA